MLSQFGGASGKVREQCVRSSRTPAVWAALRKAVCPQAVCLKGDAKLPRFLRFLPIPLKKLMRSNITSPPIQRLFRWKVVFCIFIDAQALGRSEVDFMGTD